MRSSAHQVARSTDGRSPSTFGVPVRRAETVYEPGSYFGDGDLRGLEVATWGEGPRAIGLFAFLATPAPHPQVPPARALVLLVAPDGSRRVVPVTGAQPDRRFHVTPAIAASNDRVFFACAEADPARPGRQVIQAGLLEFSSASASFRRTATLPIHYSADTPLVPSIGGVDQNLTAAFDSLRREWCLFYLTGNYLAFAQIFDYAGNPRGPAQIVTDARGDAGTHAGPHQICFNSDTARYMVATSHNQFILERAGSTGSPLRCVWFDNTGYAECDAIVERRDLLARSPQFAFAPFAMSPAGPFLPAVLADQYAIAPVRRAPWEFAMLTTYDRDVVSLAHRIACRVRGRPGIWATADTAPLSAVPPAPDRVFGRALARLAAPRAMACIWTREVAPSDPTTEPHSVLHLALLDDA